MLWLRSEVSLTRRPAISAHRGGAGLHRVATYESYRSAIASGVEYVELDVRKLRDGTLVCYHSPIVDSIGAPLSALRYEELCDLAGYEVPTVLSIMMRLGNAAGHLDLKETGYESEVVSLASDVLGQDGFLVTMQEDIAVRNIVRNYPGVQTALTLGLSGSMIPLTRLSSVRFSELFPMRRIRECGAKLVAVHEILARCGVLRQCAANGIGAIVWTVDSSSHIHRFLQDSRVDVLVTNRPAYAMNLRATLTNSSCHR